MLDWPTVQPQPLPISEVIPGYLSLEWVDEGRVVRVFSGQSEKLGIPVLLHVLRPEVAADAGLKKRFVESAEACLALAHPNLLRHFEVGKLADGRPYVVTENPPGESLDSVLKAAGSLDSDIVVPLAGPICAALDALHHLGRFHANLHPETVLLENGLSASQPKLTGLVMGLGGAGAHSHEYRAPECAAGQGPTAKSDIYSLGAILYASLTGKPPPSAVGAKGLVSVPANGGLPPLPAASAHLTDALQRCLDPDPARRFASAGELAHALSRSDGTLISGKPQAEMPHSTGGYHLEGPGDSLGSYQLVKLLGEGSMGRVFLANHALLGRKVAIKILRPEQYRNADLIQRFFQEARTVNQINHEHIVEIFDFVQEVGADGPTSVYCVMELLSGMSLGQALEKGPPMGVRRGLGIVRQLCDALSAAHKVGVVHRDVKPDNIFITERAGLTDYVKVLDFGVAKLTAPGADAPAISTMDGAIIGTPACMAPEQAAGLAVDARADIYATGVILYELLAGRLPFDGKTFGALAAQIITQPPPPMPDATPGGERIPPALKALVMRCLEKLPAKRPQSMLEIREALEPFAATEAERYEEKPGRLGLWLGLAGVLVAAAVAGVVVLKPFSTPPAPVPAPVGETPAAPPPAPVVAPTPGVTPTPVEPSTEVKPETPAAAVVPPKPKPVVPERPVGPLTMVEIAQVMGRAQGPIRACFERFGAQLGEAQGKVNITLTIELSGAVSAATVSTGDGSPLSACIIKQAKALRFPKHSGKSITINVPFDYHRSE